MTAYETRVSGLSPKVWIKFDGTGVISDSGSAGTSWSLSGTAPTYSATGISNNAYTFGGAGRYTSTTALPTNTFNDKVFTVEAWVKLTNQAAQDYPTIYRIDNSTDGHYFILRGRSNDVTNPGLAEVYYDGSSTALTLLSQTRIDDGNWHHLVFVANGNTDSRLYVDGRLEATSATNVGTLSLDSSSWTKSIGGAGTNEYFVGTIDEVAVYSEALTGPQIVRNYAIGAGYDTLDKLASYSPEWLFNFDYPTYSGTNNQGNLGSSTANALAGVAFVPSGTITQTSDSYPKGPSKHAAFAYNASYSVNSPTEIWSSEVTDRDYAWGFWFKTNGTVGTSNTIVMNGGPYASINAARILNSSDGNAGKLEVYAPNGSQYVLSGKRVDDGNWHLIAWRQTTSPGECKIYLDGVLEQTVTTTNTPSGSYFSFGSTSQGSNSALTRLGSFFVGTATDFTAANLLAIYETAYVPVVNVTASGVTAATATAQFPDATATGTSTVSWSDTPATASALMVQPALSFTQNGGYSAETMTGNSNIVGPTLITDAILSNSYIGIMNGSSEQTTVGISIDDGYTALPGTASVVFALVEPTITTDIGVTYSATTMTAHTEQGNHSRFTTTTNVGLSKDTYVDSSLPSQKNYSQPGLALYKSGSVQLNTLIQFDIPSNININNVLAAELRFTRTTSSSTPSGTISFELNRITSSWQANTMDYYSVPSHTKLTDVNVVVGTGIGSTFAVDISSAITAWKSNSNYGLLIKFSNNTAGLDFAATEYNGTSYDPYVVLTYDNGTPDVAYSASVSTASALAVDPNIVQGLGGGYTAQAQTANANIVNPAVSPGYGPTITGGPFVAFGENITQPTVSAQKSYNYTQSDGLEANAIMAHPQTTAEGGTTAIDTAPYLVTATMPGGIAVISESLVGDVLTASAEMVDPDISSDFNRIVYVGAFSVNATLLAPSEAVLETDDPYYQEIIATSNLSDTEWFRLDEISGSTVISKTKQISASNTQENGTYVNTPVFGSVGPRNRRVIGFTGTQYITVPHAYGATGSGDWLGAASTSVSEMTIKTSANSGTLLDGEDANTLSGAGNPLGWTLDIYGGKLRFRAWVVATNVPGTNRLVTHNIIGNKIISDNEWHHIVVQIGNLYNGKELEIFIDGELDIARFDANQTPIMAHPDRLFGNSVTTMNYAYTGPNPVNQIGNPEPMPNFTGEAMEYVFRPNITLTEYQIEQLYYAALDIATEPQTSWTATAEMPEPFVSGNKPKALVLSFWAYSDYRDTGTFNPTFDEYANGGARFINGGFNPEVHDVWEYYVNRVSANPQLSSINDTPEVNGVHRDPVTDEVVLLDPRTIKNINKFDVISIQGYPKDSNDITNLFQGYNEEKGYQYALNALEAFVRQVREIVDTYGTSLLVTSPRLAVDLGIIDDVESVSQGYETRLSTNQSSQNIGLYDYRSAQIDPMINASGPIVTPTADPYTYFDTHRNNKIKLVATQTGLTDIEGGWTLEDAVTAIPRDPLSPSRYSYKFKDTRNGMTIGDETFIAGLQLNKNELGQANGDSYGIFPATQTIDAIPLTAVKTGTVLAQLIPTYYDGSQERVNPFANYAAAIVVNPGDSLKGTAVGGKIYVDITNKQDTRYANFVTFQTTNGSTTNPIIPGISATESAWTNYERQWQYSTARLSLTGSQVGVGVDQVITTPGNVGQTQPIQNTNGQVYLVAPRNNQLFSLTIEEKYPTISVWAPSLLERGIMWLSIKTPVNPNDKVIRPSAMIAEALHKDSTLYINKSITTNAASMVSNVYLVEPDSVVPVDARIVVLPLTATATITGYSRFISAAPMTASAILNTDSVTFAGGEQVVVTLHEVQTVDLYMKEEAY